jgi:hypothetical protein
LERSGEAAGRRNVADRFFPPIEYERNVRRYWFTGFETAADIRINAVNYVDEMGAGVASLSKQRYPEMLGLSAGLQGWPCPAGQNACLEIGWRLDRELLDQARLARNAAP